MQASFVIDPRLLRTGRPDGPLPGVPGVVDGAFAALVADREGEGPPEAAALVEALVPLAALALSPGVALPAPVLSPDADGAQPLASPEGAPASVAPVTPPAPGAILVPAFGIAAGSVDAAQLPPEGEEKGATAALAVPDGNATGDAGSSERAVPSSAFEAGTPPGDRKGSDAGAGGAGPGPIAAEVWPLSSGTPTPGLALPGVAQLTVKGPADPGRLADPSGPVATEAADMFPGPPKLGPVKLDPPSLGPPKLDPPKLAPPKLAPPNLTPPTPGTPVEGRFATAGAALAPVPVAVPPEAQGEAPEPPLSDRYTARDRSSQSPVRHIPAPIGPGRLSVGADAGGGILPSGSVVVLDTAVALSVAAPSAAERLWLGAQLAAAGLAPGGPFVGTGQAAPVLPDRLGEEMAAPLPTAKPGLAAPGQSPMTNGGASLAPPVPSKAEGATAPPPYAAPMPPVAGPVFVALAAPLLSGHSPGLPPALALAGTVAEGGPHPMPDAEGALVPGVVTPSPAPGGPGTAAPASVHQVTQAMTALVSGQADGSTEIALAPEELGKVRLQFQTDALNPERLVVVLTFDRPETMDLFRRHAADLTETLRAAGYGEARLDFGQSGQGQGGDSGLAAGNKGGQAAEPGLPRLHDTDLAAQGGASGSLDIRL